MIAPKPEAQRRPTGAPGPGNEPGRTPPATPPMPPRRAWLTFLLVVLANYALMRIFFPPGEPVKVPYTLFKQEVEQRNVAQIYSRGTSITGRFRTPVTYPRDTTAQDTTSRRRASGSPGP